MAPKRQGSAAASSDGYWLILCLDFGLEGRWCLKRLLILILSLSFSGACLGEDFYYPGLTPDYLSPRGNELGSIPNGSYGCRAVVAKTPIQQARKIGALIEKNCGGEATRSWIPYAPGAPFGYFLVCCMQKIGSRHRR